MLSSYSGLDAVRNGQFSKFTRNGKETNDLSVLTDVTVFWFVLMRERALLNEKYKTYCQKKVKQVVLKITSGYRSALLNSKIKGASKTSQHCNGEATDINAIIVFTDNSKKELPYTSLYEDIKAWTRAGRMTVDQCIQEKSGNAVW